MNDFERACEHNSDWFSTHENAIEFVRDSKTMTVTFSQGRFITKIKKLAKDNPGDVRIIHENKDYIVAHLPVSYLKLNYSKHGLTDEQRTALAERLRGLRKNDKGTDD